jgi:hypothetical protein
VIAADVQSHTPPRLGYYRRIKGEPTKVRAYNFVDMEPNHWKVEKFANIAWEEWVKQVLDLHRIVDAGTIYEPERGKLNEAITAILD